DLRMQLRLSAGARQSRELMLKMRSHCERLQAAIERFASQRGGARTSPLTYARGSDTANCGVGRATFCVMEIRLPGRLRIIALPANPLTSRGFTADVFLDEFAMHRDDRGIWSALLPTLLRESGELDMASTPRGRCNMFYELRDNPIFTPGTLTLHEAIEQGLETDAQMLRA